ncbi:MAG TPA: MBL fold metallo-hydrolase [Candidatus Limnocylindria bacterium]|nr:MBL fold metallo-hydrolase [Candidatus Limnocylindria bacterium]
MSDLATFHVLHIGYLRDDLVAGTVSLVLDGEARLVIDPGMVADRAQILGPLASRGVSPEQVTHVLFSHHHPDHTMNAALFPNADLVDAWAVYRGDRWIDHPGDGFRPSPHVRLLVTPGHTTEDVTWLVETDEGVVACTHAWWRADRTPEVDPYAEDQVALEESRRRILAEATIVVPGHGEPFPASGGTDGA